MHRRLPRPWSALALAATLTACQDPEQGAPDDAQLAQDAGAQLDAMAPPEAGPQPDGGLPLLDAAQGAHDASLPDTEDAGPLDAGSAPDAAVDAAQPLPDGSVCFGYLGQSKPDISCPAQACLPASYVYPVTEGVLDCTNEPCRLSPLPADPQGVYIHAFTYSDAEMELGLTFNEQIVTGYSLEAFRRWLLYVFVQVRPLLDGYRTWHTLYEPTVEFLDYSQGKLHFIVRGEIRTRVRIVDVVPYICQTGHLPTICSTEACEYRSESLGGSGQASQVVIEKTLTVEEPDK